MKPDIIAIASSTGGPSALRAICSKLSSKINVPIVIVQHMSKGFTNSLAQSLNGVAKIKVKEVEDGEELKSGTIYVACGGYHTIVSKKNEKCVFHLEDSPMINGVKPAADRLFQSISEIYEGKNVLVVIVTGMGRDGMKGVKSIKQVSNCYCITESEKTAAIYGMPKSVVEEGLSDAEIDLDEIGEEINSLVVNGW